MSNRAGFSRSGTGANHHWSKRSQRYFALFRVKTLEGLIS
jgi:hypothetical protein